MVADNLKLAVFDAVGLKCLHVIPSLPPVDDNDSDPALGFDLEKRYHCEVCNKSFSRKDHLQKHCKSNQHQLHQTKMRLHEMERSISDDRCMLNMTPSDSPDVKQARFDGVSF